MTLSEWTAPLLGAFSRGRGGAGLGQYGAAVELTALAAACGALAWGVAASRRSAGAAEFAEMRRLVREACEAPAKGVLDAVVDEMVEDMRASLTKADGGRTRMLPAFVDALPDGAEEGTFYALDLGGTNLRCLAVTLGSGASKIESVRHSECEIPPSAYSGDSASDLFGFIAGALREFIDADTAQGHPRGKTLGFTFSFPTEQTAVNAGKLIEWTKGFTTKGVIGADVVDLLGDELAPRGLGDLRVSALVNDTVGVLARARYGDNRAAAGVILGTGTNACYVAKASDVTKQAVPSSTGDMVINIEWGNFYGDALPRLRADEWLDSDSTNWGEQPFEKMIGGMYLGPLVQYTLTMFAHTTATLEGAAKGLSSIENAISSEAAAEAADDESLELFACGTVLVALGCADGGSMAERALVRETARGIIRRAGRLAAAGVCATLRMAGKDTAPPGEVQVAVDGSVFEHNSRFRNAMSEALRELMGGSAPACVLANDGSGVGAALLSAAYV